MSNNYKIKDCIKEDNCLYDLSWYLAWFPNNKQATLDGEFTSEDLRQIADHMDKYYLGESI